MAETCPNCGKPAEEVGSGGVYSCGSEGCGMAFIPEEHVDEEGNTIEFRSGVAPADYADPSAAPPEAPDRMARAQIESGGPARSASRTEWDDYASALGLNPDAYGTKDELIAAVGEAQVAV